MNPASELVRGLGFALRGFNYIYRERRGLMRFALWPILITFGTLALALRFVFQRASEWAAALWSPPTGEGAIGTVLRGIYFLYEPLVYLVAIVIAILAAALASGVIASPFNDALSTEIEPREAGRRKEDEGGFSIRSLVTDLDLTLKIEFSKLALFFGVMIPLFITSWIVPGVGPILYATFAYLFSLAYFALDYIEWPASKRGIDFRGRLRLLRAFFPRMADFGLGISFLLAIPFINLFFMPAAVAGGTLLFLDLEAIQNELNALKKR